MKKLINTALVYLIAGAAAGAVRSSAAVSSAARQAARRFLVLLCLIQDLLPLFSIKGKGSQRQGPKSGRAGRERKRRKKAPGAP